MKDREFDLYVKLDGEEITLMPFIENMTRDVVLGVVRNLKGYEEGQEIEIVLKPVK